MVAGKPLVPHPGLEPVVMSAKAARPASLYMSGFRKPSAALPAASRCALSSEMMPAVVGALQEVPSTWKVEPPLTMLKLVPMAAMSGMPAPVWLKYEAAGRPGVLAR